MGGPGTAHRENTTASFLAAARAGADWIETDVQLAPHRTLVLRHDLRDPLGAPTSELTADRRVRHGVELLADATSALPAGVGLNLELKTGPRDAANDDLIDEVLDLVDAQRPRPWLVTSFDPSVPGAVRQRARHLGRPAPPTGWITERGWPYGKAVLAAIRLGCQAVVLHQDDVLAGTRVGADAPTLAEALTMIARHRVAVGVWDATPEGVPTLVDRGVTGLCTDQVGPTLARLAAVRLTRPGTVHRLPRPPDTRGRTPRRRHRR